MSMGRSSLPLSVLTLGLAVVACSEATAPAGLAMTSVVVERDTLVATANLAGEVMWMRFTVPLAIHNRGPAPAEFQYCASAVLTDDVADRQTAWSPICALGLTERVIIQPGETRRLDVLVSAALSGPGGPRWEVDEVDGTYRFAAAIIAQGVNRLIPRVMSNAFELVLEP